MLIDDLTHYVWTFPLRSKSDVFTCLLTFHAYVSMQFQLPLISFQSDNGKEFDNQALHTHLATHGIALRLSCPCTSPQNGTAERVLRTLNDCVRSLLLHAGMQSSFWAEALSTATYHLNHHPCKTIGAQTPFQRLLGAPPTLDHLRVFGCLCFPNQAATAPHKPAARSTACIFLGYPSDHRGYRCFDLASRRVITSRHVTFDEHAFPFWSVLPEPSPSRVTVHHLATKTALFQPPPPVAPAVPAAPAQPSATARVSAPASTVSSQLPI